MGHAVVSRGVVPGAASHLAGLLALVLLAGACGAETPSTRPPATPGASKAASATLTLREAGCEYEGPAEMAAGQITIRMVNETGKSRVHLWLLKKGYSYKKFERHMAEEHRRKKAGEPPLGRPYETATLVAEAEADEGMDGQLVTGVEKGTYAMACIRFAAPDPLEVLEGVWAAGPFSVHA